MAVRRRATWRSSPTATGAGRTSAGCRSPTGTPAAADTLRARITDAIEFGVRELAVVRVLDRELVAAGRARSRDLMAMFAAAPCARGPDLDRQGVKVRFLGRRDGLSAQLIAEMDRVQRPDRREPQR